MSLHPETLKKFDPKDLEEIYAHWPFCGYFGMREGDLKELKHPASPVDDPYKPMFIFKREKHPDRTLFVNAEGRGQYGGPPGFDFLNEQAREQYCEWRNTMYFNEWWGEDYDVMPVTRSAEALTEYCLAYWAHAIQEGSMSLSLHASYKEHAKSASSFPNGFISLNGHEFPSFHGSGYRLGAELRDSTSALLGAFGVSPKEIPHNLDNPFSRQNIWDIPGGKMLVVPENYEDQRAGVKAIRLIPERTVDRLKAHAGRAISVAVQD